MGVCTQADPTDAVSPAAVEAMLVQPDEDCTLNTRLVSLNFPFPALFTRLVWPPFSIQAFAIVQAAVVDTEIVLDAVDVRLVESVTVTVAVNEPAVLYTCVGDTPVPLEASPKLQA